jgi:hypothetical protein
MKLIMRNFAIVALVIGVIALLVAVQPALADNLYGSIRGTITDPSGAALSGITVVAMNTDTGVETRVTSNQTGGFVFPQLAIGNYKVTVSALNFKTYQQSGIHLSLDQVYAMNVKLELGAVSESIQVEANPVQVDSTSIQLTADIDAKKVVDLPLIGRNWVTLQQTLPGVVTPDTRFSTNYSTNGSQAQQNSYLMNGNDFNDLPLNSPLATPNPDTIAEVKMVTNTLNPEFGRNSGAILNAVTKSGTNALHGTGFWFYRDSFLQTKNYFQLTAPPIHQNRYGGTIGGPIWKRKMFFFYGLEINRARTPDANFANQVFPTVFTQAQLSGQWDPAAMSKNVIPKNLSITGPGGPCAAGTTWANCFVGDPVGSKVRASA